MAHGNPQAWPSDVTVLAQIRTMRRQTKIDIAMWMIRRYVNAAERTALEHANRALVRLLNDDLITKTRDLDDARQFVYRIAT